MAPGHALSRFLQAGPRVAAGDGLVEAAVFGSLLDVVLGDALAALEVGDGPRHLEDPVVRPGGKPFHSDEAGEDAAGFFGGVADLAECTAAEVRVAVHAPRAL